MAEPEQPAPEEMALGATEGTLRLWRAREAVRHAELGLATQLTRVIALQGRATAILGWAVTVALALVGGASAAKWRLPLATSAVPVFLSALCCVRCLWPRLYFEPGSHPLTLLDSRFETELESLESIALGYGQGMVANEESLICFARWMRAAWILLLAAPLTGLLILATTM